MRSSHWSRTRLRLDTLRSDHWLRPTPSRGVDGSASRASVGAGGRHDGDRPEAMGRQATAALRRGGHQRPDHRRHGLHASLQPRIALHYIRTLTLPAILRRLGRSQQSQSSTRRTSWTRSASPATTPLDTVIQAARAGLRFPQGSPRALKRRSKRSFWRTFSLQIGLSPAPDSNRRPLPYALRRPSRRVRGVRKVRGARPLSDS